MEALRRMLARDAACSYIRASPAAPEHRCRTGFLV